MKQEVWKYYLNRLAETVIPMPKGAKVLHVDKQGASLYVWALVDIEAPREDRLFCVVGTGHLLPEKYTLCHIGTVMDDPYVWHAFESIGGEW